MAVLLTGSRWQVSTIAGLEAGAQIFSYQAGTLVPLSTFTNQGGGSPNTNPVICDANGEADVWLTASVGYRFIVKRSVANGGATISDVDNITAPITAGANATFADLTTTGNTILGNASTDTLNVGANGIVKDASGLVGLGLAPTATQGLLQLLGSATGGIKLGNTDNTYANAFDWYEEASFTPTIKIAGVNADCTYTSQVGRMTRIGNRVFYNIFIKVNALGVATGTLTIGSLPYVASAGATYPASARIALGVLVTPFNLAAEIQDAVNVIALISPPAANGGSAATQTILANSCEIYISGSYRAA